MSTKYHHLNCYFLFAIVMLTAGGCIGPSHQSRSTDDKAREAFRIVLQDATRSHAIPIDGYYATGHVSYILPESVQELLAIGKGAAPTLQVVASEKTTNEKELALVCLKLLQSEEVTKTLSRSSAGVRLFLYRIPTSHH
jgi:hypothetical protein